jgi:hypothetical protein
MYRPTLYRRFQNREYINTLGCTFMLIGIKFELKKNIDEADFSQRGLHKSLTMLKFFGLNISVYSRYSGMA